MEDEPISWYFRLQIINQSRSSQKVKSWSGPKWTESANIGWKKVKIITSRNISQERQTPPILTRKTCWSTDISNTVEAYLGLNEQSRGDWSTLAGVSFHRKASNYKNESVQNIIKARVSLTLERGTATWAVLLIWIRTFFVGSEFFILDTDLAFHN